MDLALTEHESGLLRELLTDYLPDLRREIARTERHELRHMLIEREELAQRLLEQLAPKVALSG